MKVFSLGLALALLMALLSSAAAPQRAAMCLLIPMAVASPTNGEMCPPQSAPWNRRQGD